jgi:glucose/arabinose dehydrogenase
MTRVLLALVAAAALTGCMESARLPANADVGPNPTLTQPNRTLIPTVKVAEAKGWPAGKTPTAAQGLQVNALVTGLDHPRWVYVLPNGDVLVAETNRPPKPEDKDEGIKAKAMKFFMKKAGAGTPSANRITLLRDADGDGVAEVRTAFIENLFSPFGMALVGDQLYVANADAVVRFPYKEGDTRITAAPTRVAALPGGPRNHHWTKSLVASRDGTKLYAGTGSNSNVAENGMEEEKDRAAISEIDLRSGAQRVFASGLRNPVGLAWEPASGRLWAVVNERDELGSDLVPDYLTSVTEGAFYGWPWSYYGQHVDERVQPPRPDMVAKAVKPDYALGSHVAPLGLTFAEGARLGPAFASGAFVGNHGSWNRRPQAGYAVVFVPFQGGKPTGLPVNVLTGFLGPDGEAYGRPVGVAIDRSGSLLVADDVGNVIWRVSAATR